MKDDFFLKVTYQKFNEVVMSDFDTQEVFYEIGPMFQVQLLIRKGFFWGFFGVWNFRLYIFFFNSNLCYYTTQFSSYIQFLN